MTEDDPIITVSHVMAAGFCAGGFRSWFKEKNIDMRKLFDGKLRVSDIAPLDDAHGNRVIEVLRKLSSKDVS